MPARVRYLPPEPGATEIRIHGVGGTAPEDILDHPHPPQVAGDERAGFFRHPDSKESHTVEAYSWGGLTSRKATRALWILLLPFTLTNVAGWMVVRRKNGRDRLAGAQERLCRLVAGLATTLMIVGISAITGDLIAVQCGRSKACRSGRVWLSMFGSGWADHHPLRRLAIGLIPAVLVLVALVWLSRRNLREYDDFTPPDTSLEAGDDADLSSGYFWYRPSLVRDLIWLHVAGVLSLLAFLLARSTKELHDLHGKDTPSLVSFVCVASGIAVVVASGWLVGSRWTRGESEASRSSLPQLMFAIIAGLLLVVAVAAAWVIDVESMIGRELQTFSSAPFYLLIVGSALALVIALLQLFSWFKHRDAVNGGTPLHLIAMSIGLIIAAGTAILFHRIEVVYAILLLELVITIPRSWVVGRIVATIGILCGVWAHVADEPEFVHLLAVGAMLSALLIISDRWWPRREFRWGGPAVMSLLGVILLAAVLAGSATRTADFLDKRQSPRELTSSVREILVREQTDENFTDVQLKEATEDIELLLAQKPQEAAEQIRSSLQGLGFPKRVSERVFLMASLGDQRPIVTTVPDAYSWLTVGISGALIISIVAMLALYLALRFDRRPRDEPRTAEEMDANARELTDTEQKSLQKSIRSMKTLKEAAGGGDLLISFIVGLLVIGSFITFASLGKGLWHPSSWLNARFPESWSWALTAAGWIVAALPLAGVAVIRKSYSSEESRRKIGMIWDLATFWPRRFHPLSPPAYTERAVPELQQRVRQASVPGKCVVVAAHSQGSVVAYAALSPLRHDSGTYVSLLTYGSPLGSYFARFFPRYFKLEEFDELERRLQAGTSQEYSWRNFWRPTDPIAGCVFSEEENSLELRDRRVNDPWWWWRIEGQPLPRLQVHSDYMDDPKLREWVRGAVTACHHNEASSNTDEDTED